MKWVVSFVAFVAFVCSPWSFADEENGVSAPASQGMIADLPKEPICPELVLGLAESPIVAAEKNAKAVREDPERRVVVLEALERAIVRYQQKNGAADQAVAKQAAKKLSRAFSAAARGKMIDEILGYADPSVTPPEMLERLADRAVSWRLDDYQREMSQRRSRNVYLGAAGGCIVASCGAVAFNPLAGAAAGFVISQVIPLLRGMVFDWLFGFESALVQARFGKLTPALDQLFPAKKLEASFAMQKKIPQPLQEAVDQFWKALNIYTPIVLESSRNFDQAIRVRDVGLFLKSIDQVSSFFAHTLLDLAPYMFLERNQLVVTDILYPIMRSNFADHSPFWALVDGPMGTVDELIERQKKGLELFSRLVGKEIREQIAEKATNRDIPPDIARVEDLYPVIDHMVSALFEPSERGLEKFRRYVAPTILSESQTETFVHTDADDLPQIKRMFPRRTHAMRANGSR